MMIGIPLPRKVHSSLQRVLSGRDVLTRSLALLSSSSPEPTPQNELQPEHRLKSHSLECPLPNIPLYFYPPYFNKE